MEVIFLFALILNFSSQHHLKSEAQRLQKDQKAMFNKEIDYETAYNLVVARDRRDRERKHAPLIEPEGAIIIDTSTMSIEEALEKMSKYVDLGLQK